MSGAWHLCLVELERACCTASCRCSSLRIFRCKGSPSLIEPGTHRSSLPHPRRSRRQPEADALTVKQPHAGRYHRTKHNPFSVPRFRAKSQPTSRTSMRASRRWVLHRHEHWESQDRLRPERRQSSSVGCVPLPSPFALDLLRPNGGWLNRQRSLVRIVCLASPFCFRSVCVKLPLHRHQRVHATPRQGLCATAAHQTIPHRPARKEGRSPQSVQPALAVRAVDDQPIGTFQLSSRKVVGLMFR